MRNPSIALLAVALVGLVFHTGCDSRYPEVNSYRNLAADENKVLTLAKYEKIQRGMTYAELIAILDVPHDPHLPDVMEDVGPRTFVSLTWYDASVPPKSKRITVHLRGKTVTDKWQVGLN
jgi:hypothetical protein